MNQNHNNFLQNNNYSLTNNMLNDNNLTNNMLNDNNLTNNMLNDNNLTNNMLNDNNLTYNNLTDNNLTGNMLNDNNLTDNNLTNNNLTDNNFDNNLTDNNLTNNNLTDNNFDNNTLNKNILNNKTFDNNILTNNILTNNTLNNIILANNVFNNNLVKDPWQLAMIDNKFILEKKITKIFPYLKNSQEYLKLKIDLESFDFITKRDTSDIITKIICNHLIEKNINPLKITITDLTAGVGGNILSFSKYFSKVIGIEINPLRAEYLKNNLSVYNCENCFVENCCAVNYIENYSNINNESLVIFIDPPWGGIGYKEISNLKLSLGNISIEELIIKIINKNNIKFSVVALKLPKNYDTGHFYNYLNNNKPIGCDVFIKVWILRKMLLVICEVKK